MSRSHPTELPHTSQSPYVPSLIRSSAARTSASRCVEAERSASDWDRSNAIVTPSGSCSSSWFEFWAASTSAVIPSPSSSISARVSASAASSSSRYLSVRELDELHPAERALGLDRAGVLIDRHVSAIEAAWEGEVLPAALLDLIGEAREQWNRVAQGDVTS